MFYRKTRPATPNGGVSGTAVPSNHHGKRRYFARPTTTASLRQSRVRCTRDWAQTGLLTSNNKYPSLTNLSRKSVHLYLIEAHKTQ